MKRLVELLVGLYPPALKREFGDEMVDVLLERHRECRSRGAVVALREFWLREAVAVIRARRSADPLPLAGSGAAWDDVRVSLRSLRKSPAFTVAAVALLALGVGSSTAVFSVTEAVLLSPLPFEAPDELMLLYEVNAERGWDRAQVAPANFLDWRSTSARFDSLTAFNDFLSHLVLDDEGEPSRVRASRVFGNFFDVLGVRLRAGRGFTVAETWVGSDRVAVLSEGLWRSRFGADPEVVGSHIRLEGEPRRIIGIAPSALRYPSESTDLWIPMGWDAAARDDVAFRRAHSLRVVGRVSEGVTMEQALAELQAIASALEGDYPETNDSMGAGLMPLRAWIVGDVTTPLVLLNVSVLIVLLVACANVSSLTLVRWSHRDREMSLRTALGAQWLSLVRLAFTESLIVSALGGALGIAIAAWAVPSLARLAPDHVPRMNEVQMNPLVLAFALGATFATSLVCGMLPAVRATRFRRSQPSKDGARQTSTIAAGRLLVVAEIALAVTLSIGAVLLARSFENIHRIDPGFDSEGVVTATLRLPGHRYTEPASGIRFSRALLERIRSQPGVEAASLSARPLLDPGWSSDFSASDWDSERYGVGVRHRQVTPGYFRTLRVPLVAGRLFTEEDALDTSPVVLINEPLAREFFPGEDPVGRRICYDRVPGEGSFWRTIVGVVGNERHAGLLTPPVPTFIEPIYQGELGRTLYVLVRSGVPPARLAVTLRDVVDDVDAAVPLYDLGIGDAALGSAFARERFLLTLMSLFALSALALTVAGIYGVLSFTVSQRRLEIGVRMALGAASGAIVRLVLGRGLALASLGTVVGIVAALASGRLLSNLLYGVEPTDPLTLLLVAAAVLVAALAASVAPAARAARTDPAESARAY